MARKQRRTEGVALVVFAVYLSKCGPSMDDTQPEPATRVRRHLEALIARSATPKITVRQLLSHTSGIPNPIPLRWVHPAARHLAFDEGSALAAILAAHHELDSVPGARYAYSNIGYWLLGRVVERVSGEKFTDRVARQVLAPLGIGPGELGYVIPVSVPHANGYLEKYSFMNLLKGFLISRELIGKYEGSWLRVESHYPNGPAFGGLVGTARGFGKFVQDQLRAHSILFDDATRSLFYEQQRTAGGKPIVMTLGWHIGELRGLRFYFKEGGGGGFHSEMRLYPGAGIATVLITNSTGFDVKRALNAVDPAFARPTQN